MISRHLLALSFVVFGAFLASGCGQGEGGACQIDPDCATGLECSCQLGGSGSGRGICRPVGTTCGTVAVDSGVTGADANVDAAVGVDAATDVDAFTDVDAGTDAAQDASPDTGATLDVGTADATNDAG